MSKVKEIQLEQLTAMRQASQAISQSLYQTLAGHLKTLTPLFSPRKVLGEFMESAYKEKVPGADRHFAKIEAHYKTLCQAPFAIPARLSTPLPNVANQPVIYPWCYPYPLGGDLILNVRSPVRWVLAYATAYDLTRLLADRLAGETPRADDVKILLLTSLTMAALIDLNTGLKELIEGLGFTLTVEQSELTGDLPLIVVAAPLGAFRPPDDLMKMVAQLSGRGSFEELVDSADVATLEHPLKGRLQALLDSDLNRA